MKKHYNCDVYERYNKMKYGYSLPWGQIKKIHTISNIQIAEYFNHEENTTCFHPYIDNRDLSVSYESLDKAIIGTLTIKYDGYNTHADNLIFRMLQM